MIENAKTVETGGVYTLHSDGGHGWLCVPSREVLALGFRSAEPGEPWPYQERVISRHSYAEPGGDFMYLEEDCDASAFLNALRADYGTKPTIIHHYDGTYSRIRELPRVNITIDD